MFAVDVQFAPDVSGFAADLTRDLEKLERDIEREAATTFASIVPDEMRSVMGSSPGSQSGQPPGERTGTLKRSLAALSSESVVTVSMAEHGGYLDPGFSGEFKGGGWLNRPFVETGEKRALTRTLEKL